MKRTLFGLAILLGLGLVACDRNTPETDAALKVQLTPVAGDEAFQTGQTYTNVQGRSYLLQNLQVYISDIKLIGTNGDEFALMPEGQAEPVWLFDFADQTIYGANATYTNGVLSTEALPVPAGDYNGVTFSLGVPARLNTGIDPVTYGTTHPLSEQHGTIWTWNSGYIFLKLDGVIDTTAAATGQNLAGSLTYHLGLDTLRRDLSFVGSEYAFNVPVGDVATAPTLGLKLDVNKLFYQAGDTLNMVQRNLTHTTNDFELAEIIMNNFAEHAITVE